MEKYKPIKPTKSQIASNAIRDMFFNKHYNGIVPVKDLEVVKHGTQWHRAFGKKAVQDAVRKLISEKYINLDAKGDNWLWGGVCHEMLFSEKH